MRRIDSAVGECKCDQFYQVKVCTEHDEDCAVSLQISCHPYLQAVEKTKDRGRVQAGPYRLQHATFMLQDVVYWLHQAVEAYSNFERMTAL